MSELELARISKCVSLKDMVPGSVVELLSLDERESEYGAFGMGSFESTDAAGVLSKGRLILPERFIFEIESDGGLPAIYIYFGQVATSSGKVDAFYHDFKRVPADPFRPYSTMFPTSAHARELRETPVNELRCQLFTNTLSDIDTGSSLVMYDLKYVKTSKCQKTPTVAFISTMTEAELKEGGKERTGRLYLPSRCVTEFHMTDMRVARYLGLKKGKGGRTYHDLVFMPSAWLDKEVVGGTADPRLLETKAKATKRQARVSSDGPPAKASTKSKTKNRNDAAEMSTLVGEEANDAVVIPNKKKTTKGKPKKSIPLKEGTDEDSDVEHVSSTPAPKRKGKPTATPLTALDKIRAIPPPAILNPTFRPQDEYLLDQYLQSVRANEAEKVDAEMVDIDLSFIQTQELGPTFEIPETDESGDTDESTERPSAKPMSSRKLDYELEDVSE